MKNQRITATEALDKITSKQSKYIYKKIKKTMRKGKNAFVELKLKFVPTQEVLLSLKEDGFYIETNSGYNDGKVYLYINWYQPLVENIQDEEEYELIDESDDDEENPQEEINLWIDPYYGGEWNF